MTRLARTLSRDFDAAIRQRGAGYFRSGRVQIESASAWHVPATVTGTMVYDVELRRDGSEIRASCTCPHLESDNCRHVWAVVLAVDARQFLQGDGGDVYLGYDPIDSHDRAAGDDEATEAHDPDVDFDDDDTDLAEGIARASEWLAPPASMRLGRLFVPEPRSAVPTAGHSRSPGDLLSPPE